IVFDPKNPDIIYASAYQRRRAVGQLIGGGPEGAIYKTTDAGAKWTKLTRGLPSVDMGRIALGVDGRKSPATVFALINTLPKWDGGCSGPGAGGRGGGRGGHMPPQGRGGPGRGEPVAIGRGEAAGRGEAGGDPSAVSGQGAGRGAPAGREGAPQGGPPAGF